VSGPLTRLPELHFRLPPEAARLLRARERVRDYLRALCADHDVVDDVVLCVEEACTNAIRHSGSDGPVDVSLAFGDDQLTVRVVDRGKGFDVAGFDPHVTPDLMADGGRGLFLMAALMDELELRVDGGVHLSMVKRGLDGRCLVPALDVPHDMGVPADNMRQRALLEDIDEAFFAVDWEYRCVHANEAAGRLAGRPADKLLGLTPFDVWPELGESHVEAGLREAMELGRGSVLEWLSPRGGWTELRLYPTPTGVAVYVRDISERKRAELAGLELLAELRRSEERFRAMFEQAAAGMMHLSLDGRYERVNDRFCEMLGYRREELEQLAFRQVTHRDDLSHQRHVIDALATGTTDTVTFEQRFLRHDGSLLWAAVTLSLVSDTEGAPDYILGVAQDISAQHRAADATRRYELLSERARDIMLFVRERDGLILEANAAAEQAYGYPRETLRTLCIFDLRADSQPLVEQQMLAAARSGLLFETEHRRADGSSFPVEVSSRGAVSLDGELVLLSIVRDVSERRELVRALARERDAMATVMANTNAQVAYLDEQFRVVLVNDAFARASGATAQELVGQDIIEAAGERTRELFEEVRSTGRPVERTGMAYELPFQPERGLTWWDWRLAPVSGGGELPRGFVLSRVDVTERVRRGLFAEGLSDVLERLGESHDPDQLARILAEGVCRVLGADLWGMFEYDGEDTWTPVLFDEQLAPFRGRTITAAESPYGMAAFRSRGVVAVEDCASHPAGQSAVSREAGIKSLIAAPLPLESGPFTALFFSWRTRRRTFSQAEIDFVARAAATTAATINDARLYQRLEERERLAAALNDVSAAITSLLDSGQILSRVVRVLAETLGAGSAVVAMLEGEGWVPRFGVGVPLETMGVPIPRARVPYAEQAVTARQAVAVDDSETDERVDRELQRAWGVRAVAMAPLAMRERVTGAVFVNYHDGPHAFTALELQFLGSVTAIVSGALETARLYEAERRTASTLQGAFIHPLPSIAGLEFAVSSQLAFEPELVGGDFSDAFELADGRVVVLVGDVEGKGVRAAGLTETVRSAVRALTLVDASPAYVLDKVNELLLRERTEQFVTLALLVADLVRDELVYTSAGHPPALLLSPTGCSELATRTGTPLGAFPWRFSDSTARLGADDIVILYTDGLTEMRAGGELFGVERAMAAACGLRQGSLDELVQGLRDIAVRFGGEVRDDMRILAFRKRPA
jgi:PAS domain S-box-containing protein